MSDKHLEDFETKSIKYTIRFLKFSEACLVTSIGVMQIFVNINSFEYDFDDTFYIISMVFNYVFSICLINAFAHLIDSLMEKITVLTLSSVLWACLCCGFLFYGGLMKAYSIIGRCFSIQECCWRTNSKLTKTLTFVLRLVFYLFGMSMAIANLVFELGSNEKGVTNICIAIIVFYAIRVVIMIILFKYCTLFTVNCEETHYDHGGFMRLEEINTSTCLARNACATTDLEHVLKCHAKVHKPHRKCSPCYFCTGRKDYFIGFHQTTPETAIKIAKTGFKCGAKGMYGGGIYFARTIDLTDRKGK